MPWLVKTVDDLLPGDIIICRKKLHWWQILKRFFRWRVKRFSIKTMGKECVFPDADHVKVVQGLIRDLSTGFHWTAPASTFMFLEEYNVDPSYALVFRRKHTVPNADALYAFCLKHAGMLYNLGMLLDMEMGFKRFFSFGRRHYVCSVGARVADEVASGSLETSVKQIAIKKIPYEETPPCLWANLPDVYECVNLPGKLTRSHTDIMKDVPCE
jgi:hypothetical protein